MKVKQGKIHIPKKGTESMVGPETCCGLLIEPHDQLGWYDPEDEMVYYEKSREEVPEDLLCLACLRIVGPCYYQHVRDNK